MTTIAARTLWLLTAALAACGLAGCGAAEARRTDDAPAWIEALPSDQRAELLRPVTPFGRPAEAEAAGGAFEIALSTGRPGNLVLAAGVDGPGELPVELAIDVRDRTAGGDALVSLTYEVTDLYGRRVAGGALPDVAVPAAGRVSRTVTLADLKESGLYEATVTLAYRDTTHRQRGTVAILPASRAAPSDAWLVGPATERAAPAARRIGCTAVYLADLIADGAGVTNLADRSPERQWTPAFDPAPLRASADSFRAAGLAVIGQIGAANRLQASPTAGCDGPGLPGNLREFADCVAPLTGMLPHVEHWDLVPLPLGRLQASPAALREYLTVMRSEIARHRTGATTFWVSGSPEAINDLLTAPGMTCLVDGLRFVDYDGDAALAADVARRAGAKRWLAVLAGGDASAPAQQRAWQATRTVTEILAAGGDVELSEPTTLDPAQTSVVARLIDLLGQGRFHDPAWPALPTVRSPLFDGPRRRVAVLWTTDSSQWLLDIPDARDLEASDCLGSPVGIWRQTSLAVPVGPGPIFLSSTRGSAGDLAGRLRRGRFERIQGAAASPVAVEVQTLTGPIAPRATVPVVLTNLLPQAVEAEVRLEGPRGWTADRPAKRFRLAGGQTVRAEFAFGDAERNADNLYPVTVKVDLARQQLAFDRPTRQAVALAMTPVIDGRLEEWDAAAAMAVRLPWLADGAAPGAVVAANAPSAASVARVRAAFDEQFLYLSAEVPLRALLRRERTIDPVGLDQPGNPWGPESIQFALGTTAADTSEYLLALVPTATRPAVVLMRAPGMERRNPLPGLPVAGWGEMAGARAVISDAGDRAVYEAAIPRSPLAALPWGEGRRWRFDFLIDGPPHEEGAARLPGEDGRSPQYPRTPWHSAGWTESMNPWTTQHSRSTFFPLGRRTPATGYEIGLTRETATK